MTVGAEPKKVIFLAGLVLVAVYLLVFGDDDGPPGGAARPAQTQQQARPVPASAAPGPAAGTQARPAARAVRSAKSGNLNQEFRPTLKPKGDVDPATIDPTLRLDLLARLQEVRIAGGERSLFDFAPPPPPKVEAPKIDFKKIEEAKAAAEAEPEQAKPTEPVKPPPPPIPLKFYGFASPAKQGPKRAFFLDGEDIIVASEGELIKRRYKVVRIGITSAVVEDTEHKNEQTLPLVQEQSG